MEAHKRHVSLPIRLLTRYIGPVSTVLTYLQAFIHRTVSAHPFATGCPIKSMTLSEAIREGCKGCDESYHEIHRFLRVRTLAKHPPPDLPRRSIADVSFIRFSLK